MSKTINGCGPHVIYSISDLRGFWPPLDHVEWPGDELFGFAPADLRGVVVEIEVADAEEVVNPILGAKTELVELSSPFDVEVILLELSGAPRAPWSCACRLGDGSNGAARLDNVEVVVPPVAVGLCCCC